MPSLTDQLRAKLIQGGVRNLREFGYPGCDETNILSDRIYSRFFLRILEENKEDSRLQQAIPVIDGLIEEIVTGQSKG